MCCPGAALVRLIELFRPMPQRFSGKSRSAVCDCDLKEGPAILFFLKKRFQPGYFLLSCPDPQF